MCANQFVVIPQAECRLSGNERSCPAAGLHIAADSSVVVCLGGLALQLEDTFTQFPKMGSTVYSWYSSRLTAGMKTTMPCPFPQTRPNNKPMKPIMITLKWRVGAATEMQGPFEHSYFSSLCSLAERGSEKDHTIVVRF